jgi:hypothetical protein
MRLGLIAGGKGGTLAGRLFQGPFLFGFAARFVVSPIGTVPRSLRPAWIQGAFADSQAIGRAPGTPDYRNSHGSMRDSQKAVC